MRAALLQLTSSDDPTTNTATTLELINEAAVSGADFILTPEVTNCVSLNRERQFEVLRTEAEDKTLAAFQAAAAVHSIWLLIGSLALKTQDSDGRFANRSLLISPDGEIAARYDKMHMFDVQVSDTERYLESRGYRPGETPIVADTPLGCIGMTICYDLRFPQLYRQLTQMGAEILTVPSAFSVPTGRAHWEVLLRARAIETGSFVLAPAQTGTHPATSGKRRRTYGHSLAVAPWGEVILDAGERSGVSYVDLDLAEVKNARRRIPSLQSVRNFQGPG